MNLPIIGHQQDDDHSCGRACAQMVIGTERTRLGQPGSALPDQPVMAAAETGLLATWATEPQELATHITNGLASTPGASTWAVATFRAPAGSVDPAFDAANALVTNVRAAIDRGFPSVIMTDDHDHWETVYGYADNELHCKDPLPALVGAGPHHHVDATSDGCHPLDDTIWFFDAVSAPEFICDTAPHQGAAIGIIQQVTPGIGSRIDPHVAVIKTTVSDPLDSTRPATANLGDHWGRDLVRAIRALARLPDPPPLYDLEWSSPRPREVRITRRPNSRGFLLGVPARTAKGRSLLLYFDARHGLQRIRVTRLHGLVRTLSDDLGANPLWIVQRYGRWRPFVVQSTQDDTAQLRCLYDHRVITVPAADLRIG